MMMDDGFDPSFSSHPSLIAIIVDINCPSNSSGVVDLP
jgi:hypothetical protein